VGQNLVRLAMASVGGSAFIRSRIVYDSAAVSVRFAAICGVLPNRDLEGWAECRFHDGKGLKKPHNVGLSLFTRTVGCHKYARRPTAVSTAKTQCIFANRSAKGSVGR